MKTSLATTLSVAGVLAAGTAAFAVNSAVLSTPTASGKLSADMTTESDGTPTPTVTLADGTVAPLSYSALAMSDTSATYEVGAAGTVVVDAVNDVPVIVSVSPAAGWTAVASASEAGGPALVVFTSPSVIVRFAVTWTNGTFDVKVTSQNVGTPPATPRRDDDDDDESEEHEDDHQEHEDHEEEDDD